MKHTPSPWHVGSKENEFKVIDDRGYVIADTRTIWDPPFEKALQDDFVSDEEVAEALANARLIAEAPELLKIAKAYRNLLKTLAHTEGEMATYAHINSVLIKAEGVEA